MASLLEHATTGDTTTKAIDNSEATRLGNGQAPQFDALGMLMADRACCRRSTTGGTDTPTQVVNYGSIASMDLPRGYTPVQSPADGGGINWNGAREFASSSNPDARLSVWTTNLPDSSRSNMRAAMDVLNKPPHQLTNDEYFKIAGLLPPGPWTGDGRWHELEDTLHTENLNGKTVIVFDHWRSSDVSQDSPFSQPTNNDIKSRVVVAPNEKNNSVDVIWSQSRISDFDKQNQTLDASLKSIHWQ